METAAIVCNAVLFAVTGTIVLTEGVPGEARYLLLTLLVLLVPLLSAVVLVRGRMARPGQGAGNDGPSTVTLASRAAGLGNLGLLGASGWESVAQYPYPEGDSLIPFAVLAVGTPILSLIALLRGRRRAVRGERRSGTGGERGRDSGRA
jgi:hypothetical protein